MKQQQRLSAVNPQSNTTGGGVSTAPNMPNQQPANSRHTAIRTACVRSFREWNFMWAALTLMPGALTADRGRKQSVALLKELPNKPPSQHARLSGPGRGEDAMTLGVEARVDQSVPSTS
ncbi:hypothetical protein DPEC_G00302640 [Dallia pectoralis]|uniref:Uncharacterized protein n=1 Tax=Dallia pectoralis TaxID=75939 RepID=A0ACC2FH10_DALPE|nr:hypothetical protein DPEC_G00302640 [Dallia pectoralis]